ncbi:hypothetical protein N7488_010639, partial [Penicillium malachiteum]
GPFCTKILADYGADILKIENPRGGDDTRLWRTAAEKKIWKSTQKDMSAYFCTINRNKRSMTLNLKQQTGRDVLFRLVEEADVVPITLFEIAYEPWKNAEYSSVDNFVPGKMDELGIGYETPRKLNPSIIHASVSGYGASGPYAKRAGYDAIVGAEAGMLHITGERDGAPTRPGLGMTDMSTGLYLHGAIMAALFSREKTGKGQKIDASLFETQVALLSNVAMSWLNAGEVPQRWGTAHPSIVPYQAFKTKDSYLFLGATNNRQFQVLCKSLDRADLATDARFADNNSRLKNRKELDKILGDILTSKPTAEWMGRLEGSGMPYGPINSIDAVFSHPQTAARDMVQTLPFDALSCGELKVLGSPVKFSETWPRIASAPPKLGEHTKAVLRDMGLSDIEIQKLIDGNICS